MAWYSKRPKADDTRARLLAPNPLRVMCIGDSITANVGWRAEFWRNVRRVRGDIRMLGRYVANASRPGYPNQWQHEGVSGSRMPEMTTAVGTYTGTAPDLVLVHAGTNDIVYGTNTAADCIANATGLLDAIQSKWPNAKVVISTILPRYATGARVGETPRLGLNAWILASAPLRTNVYAVDGSANLNANDTSDGIHPNDSGNARIGAAMFAGLEYWFPQRRGKTFPRTLTVRAAASPSVSIVDATLGGAQDRVSINDPSIVLPLDQNWLARVCVRPSALGANQVIWGYGGTYNPRGIQLQTAATGYLYLKIDLNTQIASTAACLANSTWAELAWGFDAATGIYHMSANGVQVHATQYCIPATPRSAQPGNTYHLLGYQPASGATGTPGLYDSFAVALGADVPNYGSGLEDAIEAMYYDGDPSIKWTRAWKMADGTGGAGTVLAEAEGATTATLAGTSVTWATVAKPWNG